MLSCEGGLFTISSQVLQSGQRNVSASVQGFLVKGLPVIRKGDDIASLIESLFELQDGDILCIASTVVAKSEGRFRRLEDYNPSPRARELAQISGKDPRFVQAILDESEDIILDRPFLLMKTKFGHTCINAGIDWSNVGEGRMLLLPENPTASAESIRNRLSRDCAVIITDTSSRPFRCGVTGIAIGWSGIGAWRDWRGIADMHGKVLEITLESIVDEIAGMANLLIGEAGDGTPVAVIRGLKYPKTGGELFMQEDQDIIRRHLKR
ncbi:MAG: coenzyme F420-0:L-glutamate ligase [Methanotrichaceae archaeon]